MNRIKTKRSILAAVIICFLAIAVLIGFLFWHNSQRLNPMSEAEKALRQQFVATAEKWLGCKEEDGSHQPIIDLYNSHLPLARGYTVKYDDAWCATFVSTVAIECTLTDIIPTECGCQKQIELFQNLNAWQEDDSYIPSPGDIIYYSTSGSKESGDNEGWSDHVGIVVSVRGRYITTIEGNYNGQVAYRHLWVGDDLIRGYGLPDFASKV